MLQTHGANTRLERRYNIIDDDIAEAIRKALATTIKQKQHGEYRSPLLTDAGLHVLLWKSLLLSKSEDIPMTEKGQKLAARTEQDIETLENLSHAQARNRLSDA